MKKAYNVYSIFEKLNVAAGVKAFSVLLMFSICFLGLSADVSAQSFNSDPNAVAVDHTVIKNTVVNEDKNAAIQVIKAEMSILQDQVLQVQNSAREEVVHGAKMHFLTRLGTELKGGTDVVNSLMSAHTSLATYAEPFNNNPPTAGFIDVEGIVELYAAKLQ
ncbi:MAG: hypothetical protein HKN09_11080 [Saprospiraceae bacterium]|nr:hypothetical protein [Saprospiraceae bacterium]